MPHRRRSQLAHSVTFIPGDGTGPELAEATRRVLEATGVEFDWDFQDAGIDVYEEEGNPLPDRTLDSIRERGIAIKGPTTTPVGSGHRSINVALRKEFDLYACIRPVQGLRGRAHPLPGDRPGDRPREHRGPVRGHRVRAGLGRGGAPAQVPGRGAGLAHARRVGHLDQADLGVRLGADRGVGLHLRQGERPQEGHGRAQGQHHEVLRRPVPGGGAPGGRAPPGHRVRGPDHRQPLQPARVAPRGVRRDRAPEPLRGHRVRPRRRHDRRARPRAGRQHRHERRDLRGHRTARLPSTRGRTGSTPRRCCSRAC